MNVPSKKPALFRVPESWAFYVLTALAVLVVTVDGQAQTRKYSNEFLNIGVGARALGMSNAYVTSVDDVTAGYWNPAGLTGVSSNLQIGLMHSEYFAGIAKYDYGAFATPIDSVSSFGLSVIRFGVDNIPNTTELIDAQGNIDYDRITSFSAADYGFVFSYARKMKVPGLRMGASAKIVHRRVGDFGRAWGFGFDVGAQYDYKKWKFGVMGRDITTTVNAWSFDLSESMRETFTLTGNDIPEASTEITLPKLILGAARQMEIKQRWSLLAEVNFDATFDGKRNVVVSGDPVSIDPHMGLELGYDNMIFIRAGVGNIQRVKAEYSDNNITTFQPNIGIGLQFNGLSIDYALTDIGDQSVALFSNVFSLRIDLNKKAI